MTAPDEQQPNYADAVPCQRWPHTGAILVGGRGTRMGLATEQCAKHDIRLADGRTMLEHVATALLATCSRVVLLGKPLHSDLNLHYIADRRPGLGPLAGIEALLASEIDTQYLICPCDMPLMSAQLLHMLVQHAQSSDALATVVRLSDQADPQPFPIHINAGALPNVQTLLDSRQRAVWALLQALPAEVVPISGECARCFTNVNTPDDLARLRLM